MVRRPHPLWLALACLSMGLAADPSCAAGKAPDDAKRILVLFEIESTLFAVTEISQGIQSGLSDWSPTKVELYIEYLDFVRFPGEEQVSRVRRGLVAKYEGIQIDLVVAVGPGALRFLLDNRSELAPGAPVIFGGLREQTIPELSLDESIRGVFSHFDVVRTLKLATLLQPNARRVVVLTGTSPFDRRWQDSARADLGTRFQALDVEYLTDRSLEAFREEVGKLTGDTILLILTVFEDADGRTYIPREATAEIAAASGAPSYAVYDSYIGVGAVGGYVETFQSMGEDIGALANQVLAGSTTISRVNYTSGRFVVDWRQLKRWGVETRSLPPGTRMKNYEPSTWERYRAEIIVAVAVILLQTATIIGLIVSDRRRRQFKDELALERLELAHLARATQLGELSGAFVHELNQPLTAILANAQAGAGLLENDPVDLAEVSEIFKDIVADDKRAAEYITQLRRLMRKEEGGFELLDLNTAVKATIELIRSELVGRQADAKFMHEPGELMVKGNLAQLQQVIINLVMNAVEAVSHLSSSQRRVEVETRRLGDGSAELSVADNGPGISPEMEGEIFKPFVTTKSDGLGLGLAICRSIALAHGGSLEADKGKTDGGRVVLTLPPV